MVLYVINNAEAAAETETGMRNPMDMHDNISMEMSRTQRQRLGLHGMLAGSIAVADVPTGIKFSTTFNNCPEAGKSFNALTAQGVVVRIEAYDDSATAFAGKNRDYTRADLFAWWLDADDLEPAPAAMTERQQIAADHADECEWDRALGRGEEF